MRTYREALQKRMDQMCTSHALRKNAQYQNLAPGQGQFMQQQGLSPQYVSLYNQAERQKAAGDIVSAQKTIQRARQVNGMPTNTADTSRVGGGFGRQLRRGAKWLGNKAIQFVQGPYTLYKSYRADRYLQKAERRLEKYNKHRAQVKQQAAKQTQQARTNAAKGGLISGLAIGLGGGLLFSNMFSPRQSSQHQQPVRQQTPVQQAPVMAQQQRTVPQYTVQSVQVRSPHQADPSSRSLAQQNRSAGIAQAISAAKRQPKQYSLNTMQQRSHSPSKYSFSTRQINT